MFQQKWPNCGRLWRKLILAGPGWKHVNLKENRRRKRAKSASFWSPRNIPPPLVVIDGEPKFAGSIQVKKIVKEVGTVLS